MIFDDFDDAFTAFNDDLNDDDSSLDDDDHVNVMWCDDDGFNFEYIWLL